MNMREEKRTLRAKLLALRAQLPPTELARQNAALNEQIFRLRAFSDARLILGFYPVGSEKRGFEPDILPALRQALAMGKRVALPRCRSAEDGEADLREMDFFVVDAWENLRPGSFGIHEPDPALHERLERPEAGLCLVPALAFDRAGYRLGYGKGYYDRFLARFAGDALGVCLDGFLLRQLPRGYYDRAVRAVMQPKGLYFCEGEQREAWTK
jgi:5-formyltetrahydrofolate cyclo-ligase